jgi:predicted SPOUT superfamily RNA methylase MTH1
MINTLCEFTFPHKRGQKLSIAVPASFVSDVPHLREKTLRIGLVGRALAIFRIDEVIVYPDFPETDQTRETGLIATILSYMETPQYLRKRLFKILPELQYVGVLPPLRTPHHPLADRTKDLRVGEFREGVVLSYSQEGSQVDIGVEQPACVTGIRLKPNTRTTVKIIALGKGPRAIIANPADIKTYWGFHVAVSKVPFGQLVKNGPFNLVVATSRKGKPINAVAKDLAERWKQSSRTLVAFGAPTQGLFEIAGREHLALEDIVHFVVNTVPNQGTETMRTEEALYASLAIVNTLEK